MAKRVKLGLKTANILFEYVDDMMGKFGADDHIEKANDRLLKAILKAEGVKKTAYIPVDSTKPEDYM